MARVNWVKIAQILEREHVTKTGETYTCKICNAEIVPEKNTAFSRYAAIYRHFKEKHPHIIEEIKTKTTITISATTETEKKITAIDTYLTS